jgi:hypothetical protein
MVVVSSPKTFLYIYPCVSLLQEVAGKTSFAESGEGRVMIRNSSEKDNYYGNGHAIASSDLSSV